MIQDIFKKRYENTRTKNEYEVMDCIKRNIQEKKEDIYCLLVKI